MRRDILLAGVVGAIVGSWLTLVVIQLGEYGFALPHRSSDTVTENRPAAAPAKATKQNDAASSKAQPEDQAKAQPAKPTPEAVPDKATPSAAAPASTTTPDNGTQLSEAAVAAAAAATPAPTTDDAQKTPDGDAAKTEDSKAATAQPTTPQESKAAAEPAYSSDAPAKPNETQPAQSTPATPDAAKNTETASAETAKPAEAETDKSDAAPVSPQPASSDQAKADPAPDNRVPADQIDRELAASAHRTLPPQPQSEQASLGPTPKPEGQTTTIELMRPFADQAGVLTIAGRSVQLTGVLPTDVDRMCTGPSGKSWPCGQAARTAFRMYLRGRSIDCDVPDANWKGTVTGACRYVRVDLSAWLVRFGWAEPEPGSPLAALVDEAKEKKRGMYGDDPRKGGKSTLAPAPPKEDPLNPI